MNINYLVVRRVFILLFSFAIINASEIDFLKITSQDFKNYLSNNDLKSSEVVFNCVKEKRTDLLMICMSQPGYVYDILEYLRTNKDDNYAAVLVAALISIPWEIDFDSPKLLEPRFKAISAPPGIGYYFEIILRHLPEEIEVISRVDNDTQYRSLIYRKSVAERLLKAVKNQDIIDSGQPDLSTPKPPAKITDTSLTKFPLNSTLKPNLIQPDQEPNSYSSTVFIVASILLFGLISLILYRIFKNNNKL